MNILTGVTYTGTPGESGASTKIAVTDSTSPLYSIAALSMGNETLLTATTAVTMELETVSGMGCEITGDGLSLRVSESGDFSYAITGGVDKDLFRISDSGKKLLLKIVLQILQILMIQMVMVNTS